MPFPSRPKTDRQKRSVQYSQTVTGSRDSVGESPLFDRNRVSVAGMAIALFAFGQIGCLRRPKPAWPTTPVIAQADDDVFFRFRPKPQPTNQIAAASKTDRVANAAEGVRRSSTERSTGKLPSNWFTAQLASSPQLPDSAPEPLQVPDAIEILPSIGTPQLDRVPNERPIVQSAPDMGDLRPAPARKEESTPAKNTPEIELLPRLTPLESSSPKALADQYPLSEQYDPVEAETPEPSARIQPDQAALDDDMDRLRRMAEQQLDAKFGDGKAATPSASPPPTAPNPAPQSWQDEGLNGWQPLTLPKRPNVSMPGNQSQPSVSVDASTSSAHENKIKDASDQATDFRDLTEDEMLAIALANAPTLRPLGIRILSNPESTPTIYDAAIKATDPFFGPAAALADFDSQLSASLNANKNDRVFNNTTLGGDVQELVQDTIDTRAGWQKRAWNGAVFDVQSIQLYDDNNRQGNRFPNYWESLLEAGVRQPLLRGAGRQFNAIAGPNAQPGFNFSNGIVIARLNTRISDADFQIALRTYVQELYTAYWSLRREYESLQTLVEAKDLAFETWQSILAKKSANIKGGEAHVEAQARARYHRLRRDVAAALDGQAGNSGYYVSERALRQLIGLPVADGRVLRPIDPPADVRYVYDFERLASQAMHGRTELRRQSLKLQQQQYRLVAAKNFLLPQLDLIGRYRLRGFGDDLTGGGARFASASDDFASLDHQEWQFGVEMGVPAGRRQAKAAVTNAKLELTRQRAIFDEQRRAVRYEVGDAFAEVASAFESLNASKDLLQAAQDRLDASTALYEADKIQLEFLLDAQEELVQARRRIAEDQSRYSLALILVNASTGTLLDDLGIRTAKHCTGVQAINY